MVEIDVLPEIPEFLKGAPVFEWVQYKGAVYFAALNYNKSLLKKHPIIDLHYCATAALNGNLIEKTVRYNPKHFAKHEPRITERHHNSPA